MSNLIVIQEVRRLARSGEARKLRQRSRVSLREMASEIGVDPSSLSRWETGETAPRAEAAFRWATALLAIRLQEAGEPG